MKFYTVTAHFQDNNKRFHKTYFAYNCNNAGAQFLVDMEERGLSVVIARLNDRFEYLSKKPLLKNVVLDRIIAVS